MAGNDSMSQWLQKAFTKINSVVLHNYRLCTEIRKVQFSKNITAYMEHKDVETKAQSKCSLNVSNVELTTGSTSERHADAHAISSGSPAAKTLPSLCKVIRILEIYIF